MDRCYYRSNRNDAIRWIVYDGADIADVVVVVVAAAPDDDTYSLLRTWRIAGRTLLSWLCSW